jgi:hypothetical protein
MTEQQLIEATGLVARLRRCEQIADKDAGAAMEMGRCRVSLERLGVMIPPRGWSPPVTVSDDDCA